MISPRDPRAANAYTRASVEAYLQAASAERARIELAIADARARTARALHLERISPAVAGDVHPVANHDRQMTELPDGVDPFRAGDANAPARRIAMPEQGGLSSDRGPSGSLVDQLRISGAPHDRWWLDPDAPVVVSD